MPAMRCPACKKVVPIRWGPKERRWVFWPHGPEERRCPNGGKAVTGLPGT